MIPVAIIHSPASETGTGQSTCLDAANVNGHIEHQVHAFGDPFSVENSHEIHQFVVNGTSQQHTAHQDLPLGLAPFPSPSPEFYNQHNLISVLFTHSQ